MSNNKKYILFHVNNSKFINVYGMDAIILNYLFNYKICNGNKVDFPKSVFTNIKKKLEDNKISYQIIDIDTNPIIKDYRFSNNYQKIYKEALEHFDNSKKLDLIIERIKDASPDKINELIEVITKCLE